MSLAKENGGRFITTMQLSRSKISDEAIEQVPVREAERLSVLPLALDQATGELRVAVPEATPEFIGSGMYFWVVQDARWWKRTPAFAATSVKTGNCEFIATDLTDVAGCVARSGFPERTCAPPAATMPASSRIKPLMHMSYPRSIFYSEPPHTADCTGHGRDGHAPSGSQSVESSRA